MPKFFYLFLFYFFYDIFFFLLYSTETKVFGFSPKGRGKAKFFVRFAQTETLCFVESDDSFPGRKEFRKKT